MNNNKYTKYAVIALIMLTFVLVWWTSRGNNPAGDDGQEIGSKLPESFIEGEEDFNNDLKNLYLALEEGNLGETKYLSEQTNKKWTIVVNAFTGQQPVEYRKTEDWENYLNTVESLLEEVNSAVREKDLFSAKEKVNTIQTTMQKTRNENKIEGLRDDIINFQKYVELVSAAENKEATLSNMRDLKFHYTQLKEKQIEGRYSEIIKEFEAVIRRIDMQLDGPDFVSAQKELKDLFLELYLLYG